jgi:hypothetical protein
MTSRERNMLIVLGVIAAAGVAIFFFVVRPGGAPDEPAPTLGASPSPTPSPTPTEEPEDEEDERDGRTPGISFFSGRDPFVPLVEETTPTDGTNGTPTDGDPPPTDGDPNGDDDGVPPEDRGETITVGGHTVTLIDIITNGGTRVQVEVDGETYTVEPGANFAGNFQLVSVQGGCANFLFGDQSFTLCEPGERK